GPEPLTPAEVALVAHDLSDWVASLDPSEFGVDECCPARKRRHCFARFELARQLGRRAVFSRSLDRVACAIAHGNFDRAECRLDHLLARADGQPWPRDWLVPSVTRDELAVALDELLAMVDALRGSAP
ncbi:MAG: hypothetical protein KDC38_13280, partial [Planctomycetes bacterium]|nr:hypothetical protein [Planctomycetota bacterium]